MILLLSMYVFIPNRVTLTSITAAVGILGTLISFSLLGQTAGEMTLMVPVLLLPVLTGFIAAQRVQLLQRQEFVLLTREELTNAAPKEEIRRRESLETELEKQASTDSLTGLCRRSRRRKSRCVRLPTEQIHSG
jgi:diguanylate cyclase